MVDGGIGDRTAAISAPYVGSNDCGQFIVAPETLPELVSFCHQRGWSVESPTCGDRAQDAVVAAYAAAYDAAPNPRLRHRVHHAYLPTATTLELMARRAIPAILLLSGMMRHCGTRVNPARACSVAMDASAPASADHQPTHQTCSSTSDANQPPRARATSVAGGDPRLRYGCPAPESRVRGRWSRHSATARSGQWAWVPHPA